MTSRSEFWQVLAALSAAGVCAFLVGVFRAAWRDVQRRKQPPHVCPRYEVARCVGGLKDGHLQTVTTTALTLEFATLLEPLHVSAAKAGDDLAKLSETPAFGRLLYIRHGRCPDGPAMFIEERRKPERRR